jgi:tRNA (cmo5U34)-methyltransferase
MSRSTKKPGQAQDRLFASEQESGEFRFDAAVARVFPDMIRRSVPGYTTIIPMIEVITDQYAQPGSNCYDLGCSLGASTLAMRHGIGDRNCTLTGVDNSPAMIERCEHYIALDDHPLPVSLRCDDILDTELQQASVTTLNFTLQFIAREEREAVINRVYAGLRPGGIMVLSEKVTFEDPHLDALNIDLHHQFKRANGYSELEIAGKRQALENVLLTETVVNHEDRLRRAGFDEVVMLSRHYGFCLWLARRCKKTTDKPD